MVILKEITRDNYKKCINLSVNPEQEMFVASNTYSLAQAKYETECIPMAIYDDDTMVGFVMYCIDVKDKQYWIFRLMVDNKFQHMGYGEKALRLVLDMMKSDKNHNQIYISYEPENKVAEKLYIKLGFMLTGEKDGNELIMMMEY